MQREINETFLFCCKRFSIVSNEKVHNFLSYLIFFHLVCLTTPFFLYWLSWKQASRHVTQNLHRDWVTACFGSRIKTFQNWESSGLVTWLRTPRLNISLTFPEKIILKYSECSDMWNKSLTTQQMRVLKGVKSHYFSFRPIPCSL